jgi:dUTP pyrophosphatase
LNPQQFPLASTSWLTLEYPWSFHLALKHGITIRAGVIDPDYTGNIQVLIFNQGEQLVTLLTGDHIAQLVLEHYATGSLKEVNQTTRTT